MSDDEDYMSDKFLAGLTAGPSLIQDRSKKRQVEVARKQTDQIKRQRQERIERTGANSNERLQESLNRPIAAENKGFQLLAKMGYKAGQALGKEATTTTDAKRLIEPIGINIKTGRGGLGREAALYELAEKQKQYRLQRLRKLTQGGVDVSAEEFRKRATQKAEERFVFGALRRCQLTCENLDTENKLETPEINWFWPDRKPETTDTNEEVLSEAEEESVEDEFTNAEKLDMLTSYLRTSYNFCFWCGVHYKDAADMTNDCPGLTRDEH